MKEVKGGRRSQTLTPPTFIKHRVQRGAMGLRGTILFFLPFFSAMCTKFRFGIMVLCNRIINLIFFYLGKTELELPEARHRIATAHYVNIYPFIWEDFSNNGYITSKSLKFLLKKNLNNVC